MTGGNIGVYQSYCPKCRFTVLTTKQCRKNTNAGNPVHMLFKCTCGCEYRLKKTFCKGVGEHEKYM